MSQKRSCESDMAGETKKQKNGDFNQDTCSMCEQDYAEDCLNVDFPPKVYFCLALVLEDASCQFLLNEYDDLTITQLNEHASKLSMNKKLVSHITSKLCLLCTNVEAMEELSALIAKKKLHKERELKFISSAIENMKDATYNVLQNQISHYENISLDAIVFADIKLARLLPLLSIIYDELDTDAIDLTISDNDGSRLSSFSFKESNIMEIYEINELENTDFLDDVLPPDSQEHLIKPPPSDITFSGSLYDNNDSLTFSSPLIPAESFPNSQEFSIDVPDYEAYTTAELKAKLKQYGYKTSNNRGNMIKDLQKIYTSIHTPQLSEKRAIGSDSPILNAQIDVETRKKIINHIKSNTELMNKILNYEPVSIDECSIGLNCKKNFIKIVLDEFAASSQALNKKSKSTE